MDENLKDRKLNVGPLPAQRDDYSEYEEVAIRWDRIVLAALVLIGLVIVLYINIFDSEDATVVAKTEITKTDITKTDITKTDITKTDITKTDITKTDINNTDSAHNDIAKTDITVPVLDPVESADTVPANTSEDQSSTTVVSVVPTPPSVLAKAEASPHQAQQSKLGSVALSQPEKKDSAETIVSPDKTPSLNKASSPKPTMMASASGHVHVLSSKKTQAQTASDSTQNSPIRVLDEGISHAQLTFNLKNGLPTDSLSSPIAMNEDGIIKVILFTEMRGLKGQKLVHEWYRNGRLQAEVTIPVNVALQRSSSSKFINKNMLGHWFVKVVNENTRSVLLEANFDVVN